MLLQSRNRRCNQRAHKKSLEFCTVEVSLLFKFFFMFLTRFAGRVGFSRRCVDKDRYVTDTQPTVTE